VVQFSLEMKLQVFKTSNRGWGLRCVNDIPKGAFICIYAGHLLTETMANEGGQDAGDEYFADLDYIEVAEQLKEGYESEVDHSEPDPEDDNGGPDAEDDDDFRPNYHYQRKIKRTSRSNSTQSSELDSQERAVINFNPNADLDETVRENSVRRLFGKDEAPYIMDAKTTGNLGRYFNVSWIRDCLVFVISNYLLTLSSSPSTLATPISSCRTCLWTPMTCDSPGWHSSRPRTSAPARS